MIPSVLEATFRWMTHASCWLYASAVSTNGTDGMLELIKKICDLSRRELLLTEVAEFI